HTITTLQKLNVSSAFISMLRIEPQSNFDNLITDGQEVATVKTDGSSQIISDENFRYGIFTKKSDNSSYLLGMQLITGKSSFNVADGLSKEVYIEFRDADVHKIYPRVAYNEVMEAGNTYKFTASYFFNELENAYTEVAAKCL